MRLLALASSEAMRWRSRPDRTAFQQAGGRTANLSKKLWQSPF
jgi:hypothetical protein